MRVITTKKKLRDHLSTRMGHGSLGLVPTMGALHRGHAVLVERARAENELCVVSIFVNPTQFDNPDDLEKYPKTLDTDLEILARISEDILVFAPSSEDIYDSKVEARHYDFDGLDKVMEGAYRQGHFDGVGTIVEALLRLVAPDRAYFGEKDFQQLQIIRKLVATKNIASEIIGCPIVREDHGLAMSSRNGRLSKALFQEASFIYSTLVSARDKFGTESAKNVSDWVRDEFEEHPDFELEYFEIADVNTLTPAQIKNPNIKYRGFIAVYAEGVRLIDNIAMN